MEPEQPPEQPVQPLETRVPLPIAGVGSRMFAALFDVGPLLGVWLIATVSVLFFAARARAAVSELLRNVALREWSWRGVDGIGLALLAASMLVATSGFYVVAELVSGGRSPGKRAFGLRVVRQSGEPAGVGPIVVRNLLRVVDWLPGAYGAGLIASVASPRTQRLGDLIAGTIVVHERPRVHPLGPAPTLAAGHLGTMLAPDEWELLAGFWARAPMLSPEARSRLARQIAPVLRARLADASTLDAESFLWALLRDGAAQAHADVSQ
jgi:uncharacterized RDD family membrane protein YckC